MENITENKKDIEYRLEDQEYVLDVLKEYHEQTVEDCRIIGNQKYNVLISLSIALGSFIYALTQVYESIRKNSIYTFELNFNTLHIHAQNILLFFANVLNSEVTFNTLYIHAQNLLLFFANIPNFLLESKYVIYFSPTSSTMNTIIVTLILFVFIFYMAFHGIFFLMFHLPLMDDFSVKIEELQRDILFKKMSNIDLFSWKDISANESNKFKDYIKQKLVRKNKFVWENINTVNTNPNDKEIQIYITKKYNRKTGKKIGTLCIDTDKKAAILTVDGLELDQFNVKETSDDYILYESELKYRFRELMPHTNVLKPSYILNLKIMAWSSLFFAVAIEYILSS